MRAARPGHRMHSRQRQWWRCDTHSQERPGPRGRPLRAPVEYRSQHAGAVSEHENSMWYSPPHEVSVVLSGAIELAAWVPCSRPRVLSPTSRLCCTVALVPSTRGDSSSWPITLLDLSGRLNSLNLPTDAVRLHQRASRPVLHVWRWDSFAETGPPFSTTALLLAGFVVGPPFQPLIFLGPSTEVALSCWSCRALDVCFLFPAPPLSGCCHGGPAISLCTPRH